jgi:hypothetical protein
MRVFVSAFILLASFQAVSLTVHISAMHSRRASAIPFGSYVDIQR